MKRCPPLFGWLVFVLTFALGGLAFAQDIATQANQFYGSNISRPPNSDTAPNGSPIEHKNAFFAPHKSGEKVIETDSSKPVEIKKMKFGADATEQTGVFKGSLLDTDLSLGGQQKPAEKSVEKPRDNTAKATSSPARTGAAALSTASASVTPAPQVSEIEKAGAPAQSVGLSLATSPAPVVAATPH